MGRASRLKRERREATKQFGLSILPDALKNKQASLEIKSFTQDLMDRKNELYPDDDRFIVACDVQLTPNGDFRIVAATAKPETV